MFKLIFLGTGSAFTVNANNYHSNMMFSNGNQSLLLDCGSDIRFSIFEQGFKYDDIDAVFISHLHGDHVGGLEWLAFQRKFDSHLKKPILFISNQIVDDLWNKVLCGVLNSLENTQAALSTYFEVIPIDTANNGAFNWLEVQFKLIKCLHCLANKKEIPCYGLFIETPDTKIFITGDTQFTPRRLQKFYEEADIIFHDCETLSSSRTGVHSHYEDLTTLPLYIRKKMWLYHYNDGPLPDAKKEGFRGFVKKGQIFQFK